MDFEFTSIKGDQYLVRIDYGRTGTYTLQANPVTLEEDDSDDFFLPVRTISGYIHISNILVEEIIRLTANSHRVEIYKKNDARSIEGYTLFFSGWTRAESFTTELHGGEIEYDLPIECELFHLRGLKFVATDYQSENYHNISISDLIDSILSHTNVSWNIVGDKPYGYVDLYTFIGKWNDEKKEYQEVPSCFDVLCSILQPYGITIYTEGDNLYLINLSHISENGIPLDNVTMQNTDSTISISRPKRSLIVIGDGPDVERPGISIPEDELEAYSTQSYRPSQSESRYVGTQVYKDTDNITTYRTESGYKNIVLEYINNNNVFGAILQGEIDDGTDGSALEYKPYIIMSRSYRGVTENPIPNINQQQVITLKGDNRVTDSGGMIYIKGRVQGMTTPTDYKWNNNCAGYIYCSIKAGNQYYTGRPATDGSDYNGWRADTPAIVTIKIGTDNELSQKTNTEGFIGMNQDGFKIRGPQYVMEGDLEINIYGFRPLNTNNKFARIAGFSLTYQEVGRKAKENKSSIDLSNDGDDDVEIKLPAVQRRKLAMGIVEDVSNLPITSYSRLHYSLPKIQAEMSLDDSYSSIPGKSFTLFGHSLAMLSRSYNLRDNEITIKFQEI